MAEHILGLDIGSFSIKGALFEASFRASKLTDLFESTPLAIDDLDPSEHGVIITEKLLRFIKDNNINAKTYITGLSGLHASIHNLTLPLPAVQIAKVLPFEMENFLTKGIENVTLDHYLKKSGKAESQIIAAAASNNHIQNHLNFLKGTEIDPAHICLEPISIANAFLLKQHELPKEHALVLDMGHQKMSFTFIKDSKIQYIRSILGGGKQLTDKIRQDLDLTLTQAIEVKHEHGLLKLPDQELRSKDLAKLSESLMQAFAPLLQKIQQSIALYLTTQMNSEETQVRKLDNIYLTGGSSKLHHLPEFIEQVFKVPCQRLEILEKKADSSSKDHASFALSVGLGLKAAARGESVKGVSSIDFRRGAFSFSKDLSGLKNNLLFFGKWVAVVFCVALFYQGVRYMRLSSQHTQAQKMALQTFKKLASTSKKKPKSSKSAVRMLKTEVDQYRDKQEILTSGLNNMTALGVLLEISKSIPDSIAMDARELSIDKNKITLRAETSSFESIDKIVAALKMKEDFKNISLGDRKEASSGKKAFTLTITIGENNDERRSR